MRKFIMDRNNLIAFAVGLIPTIILYIFPPNISVPFGVFVLLLFLLLILLWLCVKLWLDSRNENTIPTIPIIECSHNVCICKTHDFITYNSIVTFYQKNGNYENLIGYGLVETINSGGKTAQIRIIKSDEDIASFISFINDNKDNILIRPTITIDTLPFIYNVLSQEVHNE